MVAPHDLLHRVQEDRTEDREGVLHAAARAGQVHDQAAADHPRQPTRQHGARHALRDAVRPDRLRDAGDLAIEERPGDLGGAVGRGQAGAAGREHDPRTPFRGRGDRGAHGLSVGHDDRGAHDEAEALQRLDEQRTGGVLVDAGGGPVGGDHHLGPQARRRSAAAAHRDQSPDLPPVFDSTRTSVMTAALSTALTMSTTVSAATETAVSASISTPVRSVVRTVAVISTASSATTRSTLTPETASGWHSGTRSGVRLAAMIPATRATPRASPFGTPSPRSSPTTVPETSTRPVATASRRD